MSSTNYVLKKWDIISVFDNVRSNKPHYKYCICICPVRKWFLYINSELPEFRKKRDFAIQVANQEVLCLHKPISYIDTATIINHLDPVEIEKSIIDQAKQHGPLTPSIREKVKQAVQSHGVFTQEEIDIILKD